MLTVGAWLLYCLAVSAALTGAALAWQAAARWWGYGARWGWLVALAATVTLPWLFRVAPRHTWPEPVASALPSIPVAPLVHPTWPVAMDPVIVTATRPAVWGLPEYALLGWLLCSLAGLCGVLYAAASITASRRFWRTQELDGGPVYVSAATGPAALGLRRGAVVIPRWALELGGEVRQLLLAHEREHVRAGDPRLVFAGLLCVVAMPWNPLVWLQFRRLRDALELDCDARVLASGASPRKYGRVLLDMGVRGRNGALLMAAFAVRRSFLEDRIRQIARWPVPRDRRLGAAYGLLGALLFATALSARHPLSEPARGAAPAPATASAGVPAVEPVSD